ncbi:MAG: hypothetical protein IIB83_03230 [Bacteroidetes bacterium]|nr:hypothetical protein [Bacteroidota bacterium]
MKFWLTIFSILFFYIQVKPQSNVNPNISLIGTFNTQTFLGKDVIDKGKLIFNSPELELFIDDYLNPYARGTVDISFEDGIFGVEELYVSIVRGLPLDIQIKAGKYLVGFGKLNQVHAHAWPFINRPLFHQIYFGSEGFNDIGFNFSFILPTESFYSSLDLGIFKGDAISKTEVADPDNSDMVNNWRGTNPIFVGRLVSFFTLSDYANIEVGLNASYGVHAKSENYIKPGFELGLADNTLNYFYGGLDFKYKYRPNQYTALTIQGGGLLNHRDALGIYTSTGFPPNILNQNSINTFGGYLYLDYAFKKQFSVGVKYDYTDGIIGDNPSFYSLSNDNQNHTQGISGWFGFYPVEHTLIFRLGVQHLSFTTKLGRIKKESETSITLKMIFSLGPHKAHPF